MATETEMSRPDHQIHEVGQVDKPHAHMDQKLHKHGRSPMAEKLPQTEGSPEGSY